MCIECYRWDDDYVDPEYGLQDALEEIADLHGGRINAPNMEDFPTGPYCDACALEWPCVTFLTAVGALNDVR